MSIEYIFVANVALNREYTHCFKTLNFVKYIQNICHLDNNFLLIIIHYGNSYSYGFQALS